MTTTTRASRTIAIIGGGVSGTLIAVQLARQGARAEVMLIERRPIFGLGLAYSTPSERHLLNVPAGKMSALPDRPDHFLEWLRPNQNPSITGDSFASRAAFGRYIQALLAETKGIRRVVGSVTDVAVTGSGAVLSLDDGRTIPAELVVLAAGNFDPAPLPGIAPEAVDAGLYHHNAWSAGAYENMPVDAPVAIVGTGLTAVDVVLRLRELGHRGKIVAISRHGFFPGAHAEYTPSPFSAVPLETKPTAPAYLRALRGAMANGVEWRAAVDSIRATTNALWLRLPEAEQRRFRRHLQRRWDVVRHRMAPPVAQAIAQEFEAGSLEIRQGRLASVDVCEDGARVTLRNGAGTETFSVGRVINCTGPSLDYRRVDSALLRRLFERGTVSTGPLGSGLNCASDGALVDASGRVSTTMFTLGPARLGNLIESIAVPEIREQARDLAATLIARLADSPDRIEWSGRFDTIPHVGELSPARLSLRGAPPELQPCGRGAAADAARGHAADQGAGG